MGKPVNAEQAEFKRNVWHFYVDHGEKKEKILSNDYWSHVSNRFRIGDHIEVDEESGAFWALLRVANCGQNFAKVQVLNWVDFKEKVQVGSSFSGYEVKYISNRYKWGVYRNEDNTLLTKELPTEEEARRWLADHVRVVAA